MFNNLKQGIKNVVQWLPIIWKDRQWDQIFFFNLLHKKMSLMEDFFKNRANFVGREKEAKKIKICVCLLDRLQKDDYINIAFKEHERKFGELSLYDVAKHSKEWNRSFNRASFHEEYLKHQDIEYLTKLVSKHVFGWWD